MDQRSNADLELLAPFGSLFGVKLVAELRAHEAPLSRSKLRGIRLGGALAVLAADAPRHHGVDGELVRKTGLIGGGGGARQAKGLACSLEDHAFQL